MKTFSLLPKNPPKNPNNHKNHNLKNVVKFTHFLRFLGYNISMNNDKIERVEKKYLLTKDEKRLLLEAISSHLEKDEFFSEEVLSLYFDTKNNDFAITSIERPVFREKLRVRSYNVPTLSSPVFLELKSKLTKGPAKIGNKRRLVIKLKDLYAFLDKKKNLTSMFENLTKTKKQTSVSLPSTTNQLQIARELDYLFNYYDPVPKVLISANRTAYKGKERDDFRLTFDENLRFRNNDLRLEKGSHGEKFFSSQPDENRCIIMEVKTMNSMPLWFVRELSLLKLYPSRFSKYGKIYQKLNERNKNV